MLRPTGELVLRRLAAELALFISSRAMFTSFCAAFAIWVGEIATAAPPWWEAYREASALYRAKRWSEAAAAFEAIRPDAGPDRVSVMLAARCRRAADGKMGADFTWVMHDK